MDNTYEVEDANYDTHDFDTKEEAEQFIQALIEDGSDEADLTVYKVSREAVDFDVDKEVTVNIY